jgi:hypothetical protein
MLQTLFVSMLLFITPFSQANATDVKDQADAKTAVAATQPAATGSSSSAAVGASDPFATETLGQILGKNKGGTHRYGEELAPVRNQFLDTLDTGLDVGV